MGRPKTYHVLLSNEDKKILQTTINSKFTCKTIFRRCAILLELDENSDSNLTHRQIAQSFAVSKTTVSNIIKLYAAEGITGVIRIKRNENSNAELKADGRMEAALIRIACAPAPKGYSRWTLRLLEKQIALEVEEPVSRETIRRTLKKINFDLI